MEERANNQEELQVPNNEILSKRQPEVFLFHIISIYENRMARQKELVLSHQFLWLMF